MSWLSFARLHCQNIFRQVCCVSPPSVRPSIQRRVEWDDEWERWRSRNAFRGGQRRQCGYYSGITKCFGMLAGWHGAARVLVSDSVDSVVRQCFWLKIFPRWDKIRLFVACCFACGGERIAEGADEMRWASATDRPTPTDPIIDNAPLEVGIECQIHCMSVSRSLVSSRLSVSRWLEGLKIHFSFFLDGFRGPFGHLAARAAWDRFLPPSTAQTSATYPNAEFTLGFHYL